MKNIISSVLVISLLSIYILFFSPSPSAVVIAFVAFLMGFLKDDFLKS